jgi:hypothetical protein
MKLTKRFLATLLAVIMAFSMLPITALADDASDLQSAITAYENKMNGTVYTNMANAYNAYVAAVKGYDAYVYGGNTNVDLAGLASDLTTKTDAMNAWSAYSGTADVYFGTLAKTDSVQGYSNILYAHGEAGVTGIANSGSDYYQVGYYKAKTWFLGSDTNQYVYYKSFAPTNIVMYYNGNLNDLYYPVGVEIYANNDTIRTVDYIDVNDSNIGFKEYWRGYQQGWDNTYGFNYANVVSGANIEADNEHTYDGVCGLGYSSSNTLSHTLAKAGESKKRYWINKAYVTKLGSDNTLTKSSINFRLHVSTSNEINVGSNPAPTTVNSNIYVVNYYQLTQAINNKKSVLNSVASYKEGGLATLLAKYDNATAFNITQFRSGATEAGEYKNGSVTTVTESNCSSYYSYAQAASTYYASQLSSATSATDANYSDYAGIKTAITNYKTLRNTANTTYTAASFSAFATAYDNAVTHMAGVTGGYNAATATSLASALNTAYGNLVEKTTITFVDSNGNSTTAKFDTGTAAATVAAAAPALPAADYDEDGHNTYAWDKAFADVTTAAVTYTQVKTTTPHSYTYTHDANSNPSTHTGSCVINDQNHSLASEECTFVEGASVATSGEANGYTDMICSVCQFVDESQRVYASRDVSEYTAAVTDYEATKASEDYAKYTDASKTAYEGAVDTIIGSVSIYDNTKSTLYYQNRAAEIIAAKALLKEPEPENAYNLTLENDIDVNFYLDNTFYEEKNATTVEISYITTVDDIDATRATATYNVSALEQAGNGAYSKVTMNAAPAQIAEPYVITVKSGDTVVDTITTSIQQYCQDIMAAELSEQITQADKDVAKALLNYGALADEYFGYAAVSKAVTSEDYAVAHTDDYKAAVNTDEIRYVNGDTNQKRAVSKFTPGTDASGANITITSISYVALLDPEFRFYVRQENEVWAALTEVEVLEGEGLTAKMVKVEGKGNCVRVTGLKASDFGKTFKIRIGTATIEYNGYAYLYTVLRDGSTAPTELKNLAKGVYRYADACETKFPE